MPQGSKYPTVRYLPKTRMTVPRSLAFASLPVREIKSNKCPNDLYTIDTQTIMFVGSFIKPNIGNIGNLQTKVCFLVVQNHSRALNA